MASIALFADARCASFSLRRNIRVVRMAMKPRAYVTGMNGHFVVALRNTIEGDTAVKLLLHELAHCRLHLTDTDEVTRQLVACRVGDPREDEAHLLAALLWHGPTATPNHPAIARLVAKIEAGDHRKRMPQQLPLELPERVPVYGAETFAWHEEQLAAGRPNPRLARLPDAKRVQLAAANDPFTAKFVDRDGRVWHIYDRPGRRLFYNSMFLRKSYRFTVGEITALRVKHLDRQLREARAVQPRRVSGIPMRIPQKAV